MAVDHATEGPGLTPNAAGGRVSFWTAFLRGLRRRCPRCGEGRLFSGYLRQVSVCAHCDQPLEKFRADDAPAYFTILIVGLLVVPIMLAIEMAYHPETWVFEVIVLPLTILLTLALIPFIKGAYIASLWSLDLEQ